MEGNVETEVTSPSYVPVVQFVPVIPVCLEEIVSLSDCFLSHTWTHLLSQLIRFPILFN